MEQSLCFSLERLPGPNLRFVWTYEKGLSVTFQYSILAVSLQCSVTIVMIILMKRYVLFKTLNVYRLTMHTQLKTDT